MSDVQMIWPLWAECAEFLSQRRSGAVLMESRHGEGQADKQGPHGGQIESLWDRNYGR